MEDIFKGNLTFDDDLIYQVFLNIRNPYIFEGDGKKWDMLEQHIVIADRKNNILHSGFKNFQEAIEFFNKHYIGEELKNAISRIVEHENKIAETLDQEDITKRVDELRRIAEDENEEEEFDEDYAREQVEEEEIQKRLSQEEKMSLQKSAQIRREYRVDDYYRTTDEIVQEVAQGVRGLAPNEEHFDGVFFKNIYDVIDVMANMLTQDKDDLFSDVIVPLKHVNIKSATGNNGNFDTNDTDIYHQAARLEDNPTISRYDTFGDDEAERQFRGGLDNENNENNSRSIAESIRDMWHGFKGDFTELAADKSGKFRYAREVLRMMGRNVEGKILLAIHDLTHSIHALNAQQLNIFDRFMLLNDIRNLKKQNPNVKLPMGFSPQSFSAELRKFIALVKADEAIMTAVQSEITLHKSINEKLAKFAEALGLPKLAEKARHNDFYVLEYSRLLKGQGVDANYIRAVAEIRAQQLKDIEHMKALLKLRAKYGGMKKKLIDKFGDDWKKHIPNGYKTFSPLRGNFILSAHSLTENLLGVSLEIAGKNLGLSEDTLKALRSKVTDNSAAHIMVLPDAIVDTLESLCIPNSRGWLYNIAKRLTTFWKKWMLFFPTRAIKYNIRNITGDLDAALAGNPLAVAYIPQAISELWEAYYGSGDVSQELREFQERGGAITIQTTQMLGDHRQMREFNRLINELRNRNTSFWANLPRRTWQLLDRVAWSGIQNFSDFREQWLRYACYLEYLHQMQSNDEHLPRNWGASVKDEVLAIPIKDRNGKILLSGIRDRAFKMSNELLGAYDQVTASGKVLRDIAWPFYSWVEVNAKRYYQLIKNGITEDGFRDFTSRFLKGQLANTPYYAFKLGKTYLLITLLSMLLAAFNHFVWPDDEDKLSPDIQSKSHLTLGHDNKGNVLYFDRVGAILDNLEWFGQENSLFLP